MTSQHRNDVAFVWRNFGPYHIDRIESVACDSKADRRVVGIEIAPGDPEYPWQRDSQDRSFEWITVFPDASILQRSTLRRFIGLRRACSRSKCRYIFLCHYQDPAMFLLALYLRLSGRRVFVMQDSKFDDKPRRLSRELLKVLLYKPYHGAVVAGRRTRDYMRLLGFPENRIYSGYDVVSIDRIRRLAGTMPAPQGIPHKDRHFTVIARLVPKKNISLALRAYQLYFEALGDKSRDLEICGSGILENQLRTEAKTLGLTNVNFRGFLQEEEIAKKLGQSLALILPSIEEQWGLVINEALAMGVPVLCANNVGARDSLVRAGVNGYVFEPDNADGLAYMMARLTLETAEWKRFATNSAKLAEIGDVKQFSQTVSMAVDSLK